jgi:hypothetical protein
MGLPGFSAETSLYGAAAHYLTLSGGWQVQKLTPFLTLSDVLRSPFGGIGQYFCGGVGQACCRPPNSVQYSPSLGPIVSCGTGLGCDVTTGKCTAACGSPGQPCCDGPETRATKWTPDGKLYSPNSPFMIEMCKSGACDVQSHRCFTCGNADGVRCCPPDAAQATARCIGPRLSCSFDPWGFATSGTCHMCGIKGREPCSWGCDPGLGIRGGLCDICGGDFQPPCDNGCQPGLGVRQGQCRHCGDLNQAPCDDGCYGGLKLKNGLCSICGNNGQVPCDVGCNSGTVLKNGVCVWCGYNGQPPCSNGCVYPYKTSFGVCRACGGNGQVVCDSGCNPGLKNVNGTCVTPPPPPPAGSCANLGESCVADFVSGMHCCQSGNPLLCVYGKCKACVPHGEECKLYGTQTCCSAKDGDVCMLDQASGKTVCGIPG